MEACVYIAIGLSLTILIILTMVLYKRYEHLDYVRSYEDEMNESVSNPGSLETASDMPMATAQYVNPDLYPIN